MILKLSYMAMFAGLSLFIGTGCGQKEKPLKEQKPLSQGKKPLSQVALARSDLKALDHFDEEGPRSYDPAFNHRFTQIFGGTSGRNVRSFIEERINHFIQESDILGISDFINTNWLKMPPRPESSGRAVTVAYNLGILVWVQGLIDNQTNNITLKDRPPLSITSSRDGLMIFGEGYGEQEEGPEGNLVTVPVAYRQAVLVHEARHSDCSGGITEADLATARNSQTYREFFNAFQSKGCGHFHTLCSRGPLKDIPACDSNPWGSYHVNTIFLEAALKSPSMLKNPIDFVFLSTKFIDSKSRLEFNYDEAIYSQTDHPDLTSSGLQ